MNDDAIADPAEGAVGPCAPAARGVLVMEAIWLLAILACPLIMGVMMFLMMRGMRRGALLDTDQATSGDLVRGHENEL